MIGLKNSIAMLDASFANWNPSVVRTKFKLDGIPINIRPIGYTIGLAF